MASSTARAVAALLAVQVLFGLLPVAGKAAFLHIAPVHLLAARTGGAALVLLALHPLLVRDPVPRSETPRILLLALLGVVLNQGLFLLGLSLTTATHATLVITTIPVFTYAIAVLLGKEALGPRRATGIALALLGVVYLIGLSGLEADPRRALGDLLVAGNSLSFGAFLVLSKPLAERYDAFSLTTAVFLAGAALFVPLGLLAGLPAAVAAAPSSLLWVLGFIVLGPTVGTYVLNATALRSVPASTVAVFIYLQPIVTAVTAAWLIDEPVTWRLLPAAVLVFLGVWLVARRRPKALRGRVVGA